MLKRFWNEETGALISAEFVLVATILVIGVVTGLSTVRNAVVTELADVASAIGSVDQSYSFGGTSGHHSHTHASFFRDRRDACDDPRGQGDGSNCIDICTTGSHGESTTGNSIGGGGP